MSEFTISQRQFLERFFTAAVNIYGIIDLRTLWNVYMSMKMSGVEEMVPMHRSMMLAYIDQEASASHRWQVMEINVIDPEQSPDPMKRVLVEGGVKNSQAKDLNLYRSVIAARKGKKVSVPADFFSYADYMRNLEQDDLTRFLMNLQVTAEEMMDRNDADHRIATQHRGWSLRELSFDTVEVRNWIGSGMLDHGADRPGAPAALLLQITDWSLRSGYLSPEKSLNYLADSLRQMGVDLSKKQAHELHRLFSRYANRTALWREWGASIKDLQETGN